MPKITHLVFFKITSSYFFMRKKIHFVTFFSAGLSVVDPRSRPTRLKLKNNQGLGSELIQTWNFWQSISSFRAWCFILLDFFFIDSFVVERKLGKSFLFERCFCASFQLSQNALCSVVRWNLTQTLAQVFYAGDMWNVPNSRNFMNNKDSSLNFDFISKCFKCFTLLDDFTKNCGCTYFGLF